MARSMFIACSLIFRAYPRLVHHIRQPPRIALDDSRRAPSRKSARVSPIPQRDVLRCEIDELRFKLDTDEVQAMFDGMIPKTANASEGINDCCTFSDPALFNEMGINPFC